MSASAKRIILYIFVGCIFVILLSRLVYLQVISVDELSKDSNKNAIKNITETPARGLMFDRNGKLVVDNRPSYTLTVTPYQFDKSYLNEVAEIANLTPEKLKEELDKVKGTNRFNPVRIKRDLTFKQVSYLSENKERLKGVDFEVEAMRVYPNKFRASHIFGYTKEISEKQLDAQIGEYYKQGDLIGSSGLEQTYEEFLRGEKGNRFVSVDVKGREVGQFNDGKSDIPPVNGSDLILSIDADLQDYAEKLLTGKHGGIIAMDPRTGEVLCLVSKPDFDLSIFSGPTDPKEFGKLLVDKDKPLFNRAIQAKYPPGSTWKMMMSLAGLGSGELTTKSTIVCEGSFTYGGRTWEDHGAYGAIMIPTALEKSANVFFYKLGLRLGLENYDKFSGMFNFGKKTGIDLPNETNGLLPTEEYYNKVFGPRGWNQSVLINLGIGQGELLVSPVQLCAYSSAIAMNGLYNQPHLVKKIKNSATGKEEDVKYVSRQIDMPKNYFEVVQRGMYLVVNGTGTAKNVKNSDFSLVGKTGTAQNSGGNNHSWFVGYAPYEDPKIAICVLGENAGWGNQFAAPIAAAIMVRYLSGNSADVFNENAGSGISD
ncbi:MAG: penicillin-binding protein 2 [Bacteroidetes bacterium]|nr:penicillin-binding protein 2 [Bacteroidota bacterium]MBX7045294.1 penicillin-binding protein 2 [Ignavibacteria bacterium]